MSEEPRPEPIFITPNPAEVGTGVGMVTLWRTATFAPRWLEDAKREAPLAGLDARRREILLAVCFAESYLLEWVRDEVLNRKFRALDEYFPPGVWRGVTEKWKLVPKQLLSKGLIRANPDYGLRFWSDFTKLVDHRNGLVHASASRPPADDTPLAALPTPTPQDLSEMPAGWPTQVVVALVRELHTAAGTEPPKWLTDPQ